MADGKYANISGKVKWRLREITQPGVPFLGDGKLIANAARVGNMVQYNITLRWGTTTSIVNDDYATDGFCFQVIDPTLWPPPIAFQYELLGVHTFEALTKCGGFHEGRLCGFAGWKKFDKLGPCIWVAFPETEYKKNGKIAYLSHEFPSDGIFCPDTTFIAKGAYEASPLPPLITRILSRIK